MAVLEMFSVIERLDNEKALNSFLKLPVAGYRAHDDHRVNGICLGVSRSTGVSGLVLILNTTNTSGVAPPFNEDPMISKMTSFADLVKNGVLMIIPIYAKVSNIVYT
jgi:hypothetical protein